MTNQYKNPTRHVYVVDDDEDDRSFFAEVLQQVNNSIIITEAGDGQELLDILGLPPIPLPEIIFLDINMPVKSGFECLEEIRSHGTPLRDLTIVMLSTSSDPDTIQKAQLLGATHYAVKPNSLLDMKIFLKKVLESDKLKEEQTDFRLI